MRVRGECITTRPDEVVSRLAVDRSHSVDWNMDTNNYSIQYTVYM